MLKCSQWFSLLDLFCAHLFHVDVKKKKKKIALILTFHGILHILSEHVPHDLSTDLANVQLLGKPAQRVLMGNVVYMQPFS